LTHPPAGLQLKEGALIEQGRKIMAKGQMRSGREAKKPKSDKPKGAGSTYKQLQGKGGQATIAPKKG
jgi:hypothetical protein